MIGSMIVGFLIGLIASAISNRGEHMGCIGKTFVGWLGAFVGQLLFGNWGPMLADTAIVPSVLGAVILLALFYLRILFFLFFHFYIPLLEKLWQIIKNSIYLERARMSDLDKNMAVKSMVVMRKDFRTIDAKGF